MTSSGSIRGVSRSMHHALSAMCHTSQRIGTYFGTQSLLRRARCVVIGSPHRHSSRPSACVAHPLRDRHICDHSHRCPGTIPAADKPVCTINRRKAPRQLLMDAVLLRRPPRAPQSAQSSNAFSSHAPMERTATPSSSTSTFDTSPQSPHQYSGILQLPTTAPYKLLPGLVVSAKLMTSRMALCLEVAKRLPRAAPQSIYATATWCVSVSA